MGTTFINTENSKSRNFFTNLLKSLNLKIQNKNIALANLSIHYTFKNV